ncbi:hypothetical protein ANCDUO_13906 [Ancylostoma duodenale]|uniref:Uncharacterized protein n=1 Tax=Ancylostoma duodenale TaxID=51022 RepID=A0A0C2G4M9_9BILA|nr:hypothetical protein ANCDUO_13906 [Ancylostoma duodenale]
MVNSEVLGSPCPKDVPSYLSILFMCGSCFSERRSLQRRCYKGGLRVAAEVHQGMFTVLAYKLTESEKKKERRKEINFEIFSPLP